MTSVKPARYQRILIADDEKNVRRSLQLILEEAGYEVSLASDAFETVKRAQEEVFDLLILDIRMGELSGIQALEKLRNSGVHAPVLFISGNATLEEAVRAIRSGGTDFLEKPFSAERLLIAVERSLKLGVLERNLRLASDSLSRADDPGVREAINLGLIGDSSAIQSTRELIRKIAPTKSKVLITGESGTGKELIARAIHRLSLVSRGPFIKVNCAAIPSELIESELFGHEKGAFTGANRLKRGLFELADGGTIFLDEIAEMGLSAQAKVLRVLQSQEFTRVGGDQPLKTSARILAATHKDLQAEVQAGRFREDLYFRINVVPIQSIALRERAQDIPLLFLSFVRECSSENGIPEKEVAAEVVEKLQSYSWPGNVRELRNLAERLVVLSGPRIELRDLPEEFGTTTSGGIDGSERSTDGKLTLREFKTVSERQYLVEVLKKTQGNVSQAARILDIERTYLHRKIQELAIEKRDYF